MKGSTGVVAFAATVALAASAPAVSAPGQLDCTFGTGGVVNLDLASAEAAQAAMLQPDGKLVTVGIGGGGLRISRFTTRGVLDSTFGTAGTRLNAVAGLNSAPDAALDSLGRILVAGTLTNEGDSEAYVARFTAAGAIDTTFGGGDGVTSVDFSAATAATGIDNGIALAIDSSDRPIVGGMVDANGLTFNPSNADMAVARFTAAGEIDTTFGGGDGVALASTPGGGIDDDLRALVIDPAGRITGVGSTWQGAMNQLPRNTLVARWTADGLPDASFGTGGIAVLNLAETPATDFSGDDFGIDVAAYPGNRLVLLSVGVDDPIVARINENGTLDTTFAGDGATKRSFVGGQDVTEDVLVQADGKVIVTGWPVVGGNFHFASMRFDAAGVVDTTWGTGGTATSSVSFNERAYAAALQADQRLIIAGGLNNDQNFVMARYLNDGSVVSPTTTAITGDSPDPSASGQAVTVGVSVAATQGSLAPQGNVVVSDGTGASCTATVSPQSATTSTGACAITLTGSGARTLTATYAGNDGFCRSAATESHQLANPAAATTTTITSHTPEPSYAGQAVAVQFSVTSSGGTPTGSVTVTDGTSSCSASVAAGACNLALTQAGLRTLTASYGGGAGFTASASTGVSHVVGYRIQAQAATGGSISPQADAIVAAGATRVYTITPDATHRIASVTGCGGTLAGSDYTTAPATANCAIIATFDRNPVATDGTLAVLEDSGPNASALAASDDGALVYSIVTPPARGSVVLTDADTGAFTYTPAANATGADAFTFRANDGVDSNVATVAVTITPVNDPPSFTLAALAPRAGGTAGPQSVAAFAQFDAGPADEEATQSVQAYVVDGVTDPAGVVEPGSVAISNDGTLTFTTTGVGGTASVTVRVRDDGGTANGGVDMSAPQSFDIVVGPSADLAVTIDDGRAQVSSGDEVLYTIRVTNTGPNEVGGATLATLLSETLVDAEWACDPVASTSACPAPPTGSGNLAATLDLPAGATLVFELLATVDGSAGAFVAAELTVTAPAGVVDPDDGNDRATDEDVIVGNGIFRDGFEAPATPSRAAPGTGD